MTAVLLGLGAVVLGWRIRPRNWRAVVAIAAKNATDKKPRIIICDTKMAKGVDFLEARERNHFLRVEADEWTKALAVLDAGRRA